MLPADLSNQRVAILGAGREGQAAYHWLKKRLPGLPLALFAESPADAEFLASLEESDHVHIGSLDDAPLDGFDVLLRSPGITPYRSALLKAKRAGAQIVSPSSLWFAAHPSANTICITGTKGKSTTSALVAHMLKSAGKKVQLAGNIGTPLLACDDTGIDWWVIELSSYQLCDLQGQASIGVLLNISPEHLDWHGGVDAYMRDKLRLAELTVAGRLVINGADPILEAKFAGDDTVTWFNRPAGIHVEGRMLFDGSEDLQVDMPASMPGKHNRSNVAAALTVIRLAGESVRDALAALKTYQSLPHRLQVLGQKEGATWINDSISSTPVATAAALEALAGRSLILLIGGLHRGIDWSTYLPDFKANSPRAIIAMPDNGPSVLATLESLGVACPAGMHRVESLDQAVARAKELLQPGDTVLLSPGAPSFPHFQDFQHRGREFARLAGFPA